jgi:hypothetical protein
MLLYAISETFDRDRMSRASAGSMSFMRLGDSGDGNDQIAQIRSETEGYLARINKPNELHVLMTSSFQLRVLGLKEKRHRRIGSMSIELERGSDQCLGPVITLSRTKCAQKISD